MFKLFFLYFFLIHILGDYYFQSRELAAGKNQSAAKLAEHGLLYFAVSVFCVIPVFHIRLFLAALLLSAGHIVIDIAKCKYTRFLVTSGMDTPSKERFVYLADQVLHISCIFLISFLLAAKGTGFHLLPVFDYAFRIIELPFEIIIYWLIMILLIWKPANVTIKQLLCLNRPIEEEGKKAGGFIGLLERLIILLFLSIGQYSAIGLVLTAKSIARYDEISKNKDFAEYYLLGTLLSTLIVIAAYLLIMH